MKEYFVWLAKFITTLGLLFVFFFMIIGAGMKVAQDASLDGVGGSSEKAKVGVVELTGVINDANEVLKNLQEFSENTEVKAIVLRIDSPGGSVGPSQEVFSAVKRLREENPNRPIVSSMGSVAASGGFYSAMSSQKVFAQPGTLTGSVGVILQIPNVTKISDMIGFEMITIKSGAMKDAGNNFRNMTDEERAYLEHTAKVVHDQFIKDVATARNLTEDKVRGFADGRAILGSEALELGVIDGYGDTYTSAVEALKLAGVTDKKPNLIYPPKRFKELRDILHSAKTTLNFIESGMTGKLLFLSKIG